MNILQYILINFMYYENIIFNVSVDENYFIIKFNCPSVNLNYLEFTLAPNFTKN